MNSLIMKASCRMPKIRTVKIGVISGIFSVVKGVSKKSKMKLTRKKKTYLKMKVA